MLHKTTVKRDRPKQDNVRIQIDNKAERNSHSSPFPDSFCWEETMTRLSSVDEDKTICIPRCPDDKINDKIVSHDVNKSGNTVEEPLNRSNQACAEGPWLSTPFKSSDLPLTKPRDEFSRKLHHHHSLEEHSHKRRRRFYRRCVHPDYYPSHRLSLSRSRSGSYSHSSIEDGKFNDKPVRDEYKDDEPDSLSPLRKRERPEEKNRHNLNLNLRHRTDVSPDKQNYSPGMKKSEQSITDSSIGPVFDLSQLTPQTMDSETLSRFTEFTQDMRRDLKRRYKDLSRLLREFTQNVKEKNENNNTGANEAATLNKSCVLM